MRLEWKEEGPVRLNRALTRAERFHHTRARELSALGFYEPAQQEIQELEKSVRKTLTGVLWLAQLYQRARSYSDSVRLLQLYRDYRSKENEKDLSHKFWRFFFPLAYADIIQSKSSKHDIDPYFVKGLIRQESLFDTGSLSPAGARGLMQIMPETGKKLYSQEAGGKPFELEDLHDPGFNIHLGIKYLGQLKQRFGNNGTYTLISYNAGPHVLKKWLIRFKDLDDEDVFIESIPYPETRRYVKHVLRNYGI
ncbi:MAG: transglycosylase SLT domain-containing protein, partial [Nitrospinaceae bacterium]|nr:transglycosylase SLT domain-containing protein [Nitrospinaceae bacterium]NIW61106.1 transglycosylase SLT domain-containing protein [Nitrospinaceae bacterium]